MLFAFEGPSDAVWLAIVGIIAMTVKEYFDRSRAATAAVKVEEVKATAEQEAAKLANQVTAVKTDLRNSAAAHQEANDRREEKLDNLTDAVDMVQKQTNNITAVHLKTIYDMAQRLAKDGDPDDAAVAAKAKKDYDLHIENQARADAPKRP